MLRPFTFLSLLCFTIFAHPAHAEEASAKQEKPDQQKVEKPKIEDKENPARFAPDFCDFEITFPEAPFNSKKCFEGADCYDLQSYTMVYDLSTTVDVSVTCNPSTPEAYKRYNEQVMKAALTGMIDDRQLNEHNMAFRQFDKTKNASLSGTGITGTQEKIYVGQLWIGSNSVFTVQAELVGGEHPVADKSFRDILASIKEKPGKQLPKKPKASLTSKEKNQ